MTGRLREATSASRVTDALQNTAVSACASPLSVLLVDDCPIQQLVACALLGRWKVIPRIACDGLEAVLLAGERDFDIILMDVEMPMRDGLTATALIRLHERRARRGQRVPIVACTTGTLAQDEDRWRLCGMNGVLDKPCDVQGMTECLERWCPSGFAASKDQNWSSLAQRYRGTNMHDDKRARGASDRMHLNLDDEQEVIATAKALCVTPQELRDAVVTTGTDIAALQEHFESQ